MTSRSTKESKGMGRPRSVFRSKSRTGVLLWGLGALGCGGNGGGKVVGTTAEEMENTGASEESSDESVEYTCPDPPDLGPPEAIEEDTENESDDASMGEVPGCDGPWKDEAALVHGKQRWVHTYEEILDYSVSHFDAVAVSKGGVIVAAAQPGNGEREHLLLAYSVQGEPLWTLKGAPTGYMVRKMMAAHDHGILLTGMWNPPLGEEQRGGRMFVRKIDDAGNTVWTTDLSWTIDQYGTQGEDIAVGPDGTIVVSGRCVDFAELTGSDLCTAQFSPDGQEQWVRHYNDKKLSPHEVSEERIKAVDIASDGSVFVFGVVPNHVGSSGAGDEGFLRYSKVGEFCAKRPINTHLKLTNRSIFNMALSQQNALIVSYMKEEKHPSPFGDLILFAGISAFDWQANRLWHRHRIGPKGAYGLHPHQVEVASNGDITLSASVFGCEPDSKYTERIWLSRFSPQGETLWSRLWIPPEPDPEHHYSTVVNQMAIDDEGRTYLAGTLMRTFQDHDSPRPRAFVVAFGP